MVRFIIIWKFLLISELNLIFSKECDKVEIWNLELPINFNYYKKEKFPQSLKN